jgi:hypothetical protein
MTSWNEEYGRADVQMPRLLWARVSIEPGREAARLVVEEWEIPRGRSLLDVRGGVCR